MKFFLTLLGFGFVFASCRKQQTVFSSISPDVSGITFINDIKEYDTFNILNTEFIYNGAGVAVGDLNGDTLEDLYFAGNQVDNKCYLNEGNFKFRDITSEAHVQKYSGQWSSGVNIIDINGDGKKDIYVCNTLIRNADKRKNLLFINQGNLDGVPQFKELASEYGMADTSYASHAQFFDYDRDGDLDLFIGTNYIDRPVPGQFIKGSNDKCDLNCDKLYRNDWDSLSMHPVFTDVSAAAGMAYNGYSHSTLIYDFNEDGWQDIYVANDYLSDDLMYINNHDGTFTNKIGEIFRHQSSSAMGSDLGDINNDGRMDVMTAEMLPFTNL
ncbi:MAG: VCBS repeat-containing protein, partial [Saprospiraceae bacterium]